MTRLSLKQQREIETVVTPARASFDSSTREQFTRDAGPRPHLRLVEGRALPDVVVWPEEEWELAQLVNIALANDWPVVPRGGGRGVYGGAVPTRGGILIDMTRFSGVVAVNSEDELVTVRAGTRWTELESELRSRGLATCVYPTSAPTATVGGWLAQGGAGVGSHAFGWIDDTVEGVRVVGGDGKLHNLESYDIDAVAGAEGTTGILAEVRLRTRPSSDDVSALLAVPDAASLDNALRLAKTWELPIWSATFVNARGVQRLSRARGTHDLEGEPRLTDKGFVLQLVYSAVDAERVGEALRELERTTGGTCLEQELADLEWSNRFKPLRWSFPNSSVAPAEAVIPTYNLAAFLEHVERALGPDLLIEGTSVAGWETVVRVFPSPAAMAPADNSPFRLTFDVLGLAERHGGHASSTGRYLGRRVKSALGKQRLEFMRSMRAWLDPAEIMNPGKVAFGNTLIGYALEASTTLARFAPARRPRG